MTGWSMWILPCMDPKVPWKGDETKLKDIASMRQKTFYPGHMCICVVWGLRLRIPVFEATSWNVNPLPPFMSRGARFVAFHLIWLLDDQPVYGVYGRCPRIGEIPTSETEEKDMHTYGKMEHRNSVWTYWNTCLHLNSLAQDFIYLFQMGHPLTYILPVMWASIDVYICGIYNIT